MTKFYKNHEIEDQIIARAWKDPEYKKRLMKNPRKVMEEAGYTLPKDLEVKVIEDKPNTYTFCLASSPIHEKELQEESLKQVAGSGTGSGTGQSCGGCQGTANSNC